MYGINSRGEHTRGGPLAWRDVRGANSSSPKQWPSYETDSCTSELGLIVRYNQAQNRNS